MVVTVMKPQSSHCNYYGRHHLRETLVNPAPGVLCICVCKHTHVKMCTLRLGLDQRKPKAQLMNSAPSRKATEQNIIQRQKCTCKQTSENINPNIYFKQ